MYSCGPVKVLPVMQSPQPESKDKKGQFNSFYWSLEPITRWMCLLGIPLSINSSTCRLSCRLNRNFCFLLVLFIHSSQIIHMVFNARSIATSYITGTSTSALSWNFIIESVIIAFYAVGGHSSLLHLTRTETWTDLVNSFQLLEENLPSSDIYPACRKLTTITLIYTISSTFCVDLFLGLDMICNESTLMRRILDMSSFTTKIYPITALGLFCILTRIVSLHLGVIRKRIEDQLNHSKANSALSVLNEQLTQLKTLRRHHRLVCNSVRQLNHCFGFFLLVEVSFIFVTSINCFMYLFSSATTSDRLMGLLYGVVCVDCLVHLFLITSFSDDIVSQTDKVQEALAELFHEQQPSFQNEVASFAAQISQLKTYIHAMGFFNVSKHLFPSLIGTTLTYFFILLQFHSAEKS